MSSVVEAPRRALQGTPRISYVNLGCRVNRVELDDIALALEGYGCISDDVAPDAVVVNSCIVTGEAQAKTRKAIRRAAKLASNPLVVVTGCATALFADEVASLSDRVIVEPDRTRVATTVLESLGSVSALSCADTGTAYAVTPTGRTRPGVKVQDGCDCKCSFCIVWKARGSSRSVAYADVLQRVQEAAARGAKEVVLTGINLGRYEDEADGATRRLDWLLQQLLHDTDVERFRLSSIEPQDVNTALLETIASSRGRIAPFLHLPLQSGCTATLHRMYRAYTAKDYRAVVEQARSYIPDVALCCDLIVGFPGETDTEFEESFAFCETVGFSRMHIFRYSARPGTPAAEAPNQVKPAVMATRAARMREMAQAARASFSAALVGTEQDVVVQASGKGLDGHLVDVLVDENLAVNSMHRLAIQRVEDVGLLDARTR